MLSISVFFGQNFRNLWPLIPQSPLCISVVSERVDAHAAQPRKVILEEALDELSKLWRGSFFISHRDRGGGRTAPQIVHLRGSKKMTLL